ncbi:hypothetical protein PHYPSEUDO_009742 [Phytophthora pseudosyringae]|uniref:Uncharacterized protein n=1 Tax=Phytophthora pseudosyringae TaxID=221518 RepID=A0A8T1VBS4_9STRA|nr:hypothetical protein PHYPSEUDO_009742 [Phytophthora pseudosyringae]
MSSRSAPGSASKKKRKPLTSLSMLAPSSSMKAGGSSAQPIDLSRSASSTPKATPLKPLSARLLLPDRPVTYTPVDARPRRGSPGDVSEASTSEAVPPPHTWRDTRLDVRELMRAGAPFWDAVTEASEKRVRHNRFDRRELIRMVTSVIYCGMLDSTPWFAYVPEKYFDFGAQRVQSSSLDKSPPRWDSLPTHRSLSDSDSDSFMSWISSEASDDDSNDK